MTPRWSPLCAVLATAGMLASTSPAAAPASAVSRKARLATFAGLWYGHTRSLTITRKGRAKEVVYDGCCIHVIDVRFQLSRVRGVSSYATARARVTSVRVYKPSYYTTQSPPHAGDVRRLRLRHGVITEPFVGTNYCNKAAGRRGTCGA